MNRLRKLFSSILEPVYKEQPLFLFAVFLIGQRTIRFMISFLTSYDPEPPHTLFTYTCQLSIIIVYAFLLALIVHAAKNRIAKLTVYVILLILFSIDFYLVSAFGYPISPYYLSLILETTPTEAGGFFETYLFTRKGLIIIGKIGVITAAIIMTERLWNIIIKKHFLPNRHILHIAKYAILAALCLGVYSCATAYRDLFSRIDTESIGRWRSYAPLRPIDTITNIVYSYHHLFTASEEAKNHALFTRHAINIGVSCKDSVSVVLVIGESYSRHHSSLYDYELTTCPKMEAERDSGRLFVFNDVITPFAGTSLVIRNVLCCNSVSENEKWWEKPYMPAVFKRSGFNVFMYDNQRALSRNIASEYTLDSFLYNDSISELSYDYVNESIFKYDGELVDRYSKVAPPDARNFIIYHLNGQHIKAASHYPHNAFFDVFSQKDITRNDSYLNDNKKQEIADYDNATRYNDYVLDKIFNYYKDKNAVVVYFSDHGDEIYDYRDNMGRGDVDNMTSNLIKCIYEIPFIIWCSNTYQKNYPSEIVQIKNSLNHPFSTENVCHLLFYLGGIRLCYDPSRNPLLPDYVCNKRIITREFDVRLMQLVYFCQ